VAIWKRDDSGRMGKGQMYLKDYGEHFEEDAYGIKHWYLHGEWHREGAPAVVFTSGAECWYQHGKLHREDGPADIYSDGDKYWWLYGELLTKEEWEERVKCT
jgi:hypothetical protein